MTTKGQELVDLAGGLPVLHNNEVLLVLLLLDDSGSIRNAGNTSHVIEGHNSFVEELKKAIGKVLVKRMFLNNPTDTGFVSPSNLPLLSAELSDLSASTYVYLPEGETPLYMRSVDALHSVLEESRRLTLEGIVVRTITLIFTDGGDNRSMITHASDVKRIVDSMLPNGINIVGGCAVSDGHTNFWHVFNAMGIPENWIKVLRDGREVRESMTDMGSMTAEASRGAEHFTRTHTTGFTRPSSTTPT